jgi:protein phosphatase
LGKEKGETVESSVTKELSAEQKPASAIERGGPRFLVGAATDKGCVKDHNQDALFVLNASLSQGEDLSPLGLFVVADGVGERELGACASSLAVRLVADRILDRIYRPFLLDAEQTSSRPPIHQVLREAAHAAHERVQRTCPGGHTTLTCVLVLGTNAFVAHVGDSRAYVVHEDTLRQITTDHSLMNRLIEVGQITPHEAKTHPQRNVLYRALGREGNLDVDTYLQSVPAKSVLLLCSDGLWGSVSEEALLSIVLGSPSPQIACHRLVTQANSNGGEDNVTAVVVEIRH